MTERISLITYLDFIALTLFERIGKFLVTAFDLEKKLRASGHFIYPVTYACRILLYTFLSTMLLVAISTLLLTFTASLVVRVVCVIIAVSLPIIVFAFGLIYPTLVASLRKFFVESELPFYIAYLATMVRGGVGVETSISNISRLKVFRYVSAEAKRMIRQIKVFGDDPVTAIEKVAYEHPSSRFRDIMLGYVATLRAGGDVKHYLEIRARETLASRVSEIKIIVDRLLIYLEVYTIIGVVVSLTVFTFFAVSGAIAVVGGPRLREVSIDPMIPLLYNVLILPTVGIVTLVLIHFSHPRTSLPHRLPYVMMLLSIPTSLLTSLAIIILGDSLAVFEGTIALDDVSVILISITAGLSVLSIPPWITYSIERRGTKGLVKSLADFLRDLSEVRKSGLSPEKCFIVLSHRHYGNLTTIIRRSAVALATGISLDKALSRAVGRVKDWFLAVIFRFLVDSVLVGGGSPEVIDSLANFTQGLSESEEELRSRLKAYIILPYFGAIMIAISPIIIIWQLMAASPRPPDLNVLASLITILSLGAIINSYIMGLIAGKVGNLTIVAGFKHSVIMVAITTATLLVTLTILKVI